MSTETAEVSRFDAESATGLTIDFLKRLGYKENWLPMKVSIDGELYIVEMMYQKMSAKVQINSQTKEIKEYELQENQTEHKSFFNSTRLMFIVIGASAAVVILNLLGFF